MTLYQGDVQRYTLNIHAPAISTNYKSYIARAGGWATWTEPKTSWGKYVRRLLLDVLLAAFRRHVAQREADSLLLR